MASLSLSSPALSIPTLSVLSLPSLAPSLPPSSLSTPTPTPSTTPVPSSTPPTPTPSTPTPTPTPTPSTQTAPTDATQSSFSPTLDSGTPSLVVAGTSSVTAVVYASVTPTPAPTSALPSSSPPSFFSNTGAVAGTFTAVGLVAFAGVLAVALLIIRRRNNSRSYDDDMEYLDRTDPMTQMSSPEDGLTSEQSHYPHHVGPASPPIAYYPDHAYALHPQAFSPTTPAYPAAYTQPYGAQRIYSDDYDIAYPRANPNMPNPHVELDSPPQPLPPNALRPSVKSPQADPKHWSNTRFSVDSFYAGIAPDNQSPPGRAR